MPRFLISNAAQKQQVFELHPGEFVIGRDQDAAIMLPNVSVSRQHAKVTVDKEGATLEDLSSGNGTQVNGAVVLQHRLQSKDEVKIGKFSLVYLSDHRSDDFYKGRSVKYLARWEPRGAEVSHDETFVLSKDALKAMATQSRLMETGRVVLVRDPKHFWHPEDRPLSFGDIGSSVRVKGWFIFGTVAEVMWDGARHVLKKNAWWVPVRVNDAAIEKTPLKNGDRITIGESSFRYEGEK